MQPWRQPERVLVQVLVPAQREQEPVQPLQSLVQALQGSP